jgi:hypothetical protein
VIPSAIAVWQLSRSRILGSCRRSFAKGRPIEAEGARYGYDPVRVSPKVGEVLIRSLFGIGSWPSIGPPAYLARVLSSGASSCKRLKLLELHSSKPVHMLLLLN